MTDKPKVLLGDSTPSSLAPNVLDVLVQLVVCAREVGTLYAEIENLEQQRADSVDKTASIIADLDKFKQHSEIGLRATASEATRTEVLQHAEEAIGTISSMVDRWRKAYSSAHDREVQRINARLSEIERGMRTSLERLLLPMRMDAAERKLARVFDGQQYTNTIDAEFVPGLRMRLDLQDSGGEAPQRLRSLLGEKGTKIQVGTKRGLLRRAEEPNFVTLDDYLILDAEVNPETLRVVLAKKPGGGADALRLELAAQGSGAAGRAVLPDGTTETIPDTDRAVLTDLWRALHREVERIVALPGRLTGLSLDETPVDDGTMILGCMERLVDFYRPVVSKIAAHSTSPEELTIKIEREGGRREEAYVKKADLAQHLMALPRDVRERLAIEEILPEGDAESTASFQSVGTIAEPDAGAHSGRIVLDIESDDEPPTSQRNANEAAPAHEVTEDISLRDIVVDESGVLKLADDECASPARVVRSGSSS